MMKTRTEALPADDGSLRSARAGFGVLGLVSFVALCGFAWTHPLGWGVGALIAASFVTIMALRREAWLVVVPALVPVVDLAAWTGEIYFTESDALVLSALAVGGLWVALQPGLGRHEGPWRFGLLSSALAIALLTSYLVSTAWMPVLPLVGEPWLQVGYSTPVNGLRLMKGFVWAILLLPLLAFEMRMRERQSIRALVAGLVLGMTMVSLGAVWERAVFTGLTDFASDYRTTSMFWEMNVGGATLDGWLALVLPFALWLTLRESREVKPALLAMLALAGYACFTTFSRGLYLGLVVGGGLTMLLMARNAARTGKRPVGWFEKLGYGVFVVVVAGLLDRVFQTGGYRGLTAMLGLAAGVYVSGPIIAVESRRVLGYAGMLALPAGLVSIAALWFVPKGVYLAYTLSGGLLIALLRLEPVGRGVALASTALIASLLWLAINAVLVSAYWAQEHDVLPAFTTAAFLLLPLLHARVRPAACWRPDARGWVRLMLVMGGVAVVVVTFNTYYASKRFETVSADLAQRWEHWAVSASLPQGMSESLFGVGTGQFAERYFWRVPDGMYPGTHRMQSESGNVYLQLGGARHVLGAGELYRISQRVVPSLEAPLVLGLRARAPGGDARLHVEVCRKHLLYGSECTTRELKVPANGEWNRFDAVLEQGRLGGGGGWLPRLTTFSLANASRGRLLEVDDVSLIDRKGRVLIDNGDFSAAGKFWFFTSDRYHLPWHAKNLWLHFFVEQGAFGLVAFSLLSFVALYRVSVGRAASHVLSPPLAGALAGFLVVGMFDSLLDSPRLALLAFLLMFVALGLNPVSHGGSRGDGSIRARSRQSLPRDK
ncbi:MAG: hypothetical protein RBT39_15110 [Azoarcus sp.]|jgi:hypothetical protein|nr:hypothetical protein [Azoarcus sp.]